MMLIRPLLSKQRTSLFPAAECLHIAREISKKHRINNSLCHAIENTLLKLADIDEVPQNSSFATQQETEFCFFSFAISPTSAKNLFAYLKKTFPELDATIVDFIAEQKEEESKEEKSETFIIKVNADVLKKEVLPLIDQYLNTHPEEVHQYHKFSFRFEELVEELQRQAFEPLNVSLFLGAGLGQLLWEVIQINALIAEAISAELLNNPLPNDLCVMIHQYLAVTKYENINFNDITIMSSTLRSNLHNSLQSDLDITFLGSSQNSPEKVIATTFNGFTAKSATAADSSLALTRTKTVTIDNVSLADPDFIATLKNQFQSKSEPEQDCLRKLGHRIKYTLIEELTTLKQIALHFEKHLLDERLKEATSLLRAYIKTVAIKDLQKENQRELHQYEQQIQSLFQKHFTEESAKDPKSASLVSLSDIHAKQSEIFSSINDRLNQQSLLFAFSIPSSPSQVEQTLGGIFSQEGIGMTQTNCFAETLWRAIKEKYKLTSPVTLLSHTLQKSFSEPHRTNLTVTFQTSSSSIEPAQPIIDYLNGLAPGTAELLDVDGNIDDKEMKSQNSSFTKTVVITADDSTWTHPSLLADLERTFKLLSIDELDRLRKITGTLQQSTNENLLQLKKIQRVLVTSKYYQEKTSAAELANSLQVYIGFAEMEGITSPRLSCIVEKVLADLSALETHLQPELEKQKKVGSNSFFKSETTFEDLAGKIKEILKQFANTAAKKFSLEAMNDDMGRDRKFLFL